MRCATLAEELRSRGAAVTFLCRALPGNYIDWLVSKQFDVIRLSAPMDNPGLAGQLGHLAWLGVPLEQEMAEVRAALSPRPLHDWLIVDHYALGEQWEAAARSFATNIMVIDDLADRRHDCDVLLDQNFYADMQQRYDHLLSPACKKLLGPGYALLRREFLALQSQIQPREAAVRRVLVFFGGVDADNYTAHAIAALARAARPEVQVDVVIGAGHPARTAIVASCQEHGYHCHVQTSRMAELMVTADLAIGAGGTATWERCCVGLPALTVCVADNQRRLVDDAACAGFIYAPRITLGPGLEDALLHHYVALLDNPGLRSFLSRRSLEIVDGRGAVRVARLFGGNGIAVRAAVAEDSAALMAWRNHDAIRAVSRSTAPIPVENHQRWFDAVLHDAQRILLIGHHADGQAAGVVRFDVDDGSAEVSIYLVPGTKQRGMGADLLASAEQWLRKARPDINTIKAEVLGDNQPSHRLFLAASYTRNSTSYFKKVN